LTTDEKREKIFLAVLDYAQKFGDDDSGKFRLAISEQVYQSDEMQIDGLELICELLDILNSES
jgi:hypothetical protein